MAYAAPVRAKIPTKNPQPVWAGGARPDRPRVRRAARSRALRLAWAFTAAVACGRPCPAGMAA